MRMEIFVVEMATSMSIMSGTAARRVSNPRRMSVPQTISNTPTKGAISSGDGIPILMKRPHPSLPGRETSEYLQCLLCLLWAIDAMNCDGVNCPFLILAVDGRCRGRREL